MGLKPLTVELWENGTDEELEPYRQDTLCECGFFHLTKEATRQVIAAQYESDRRRKQMEARFSGEEARSSGEEVRGMHGLL